MIIYNDESKISLLQTVQSRRNTFYLRASHFCGKSQHTFLALIFLCILKKFTCKDYVRLWKWNLKLAPQSAQNPFSFFILFNIISFANHQGSAKIRLACLNLLLINYFDRRLKNTFNTFRWLYKRRQIFFIKDDKYYFL